jgi:hypothetical protein
MALERKLRSSQDCPHTSQEFFYTEGLGEIIIGLQIETTNFIPVLSTSRQDDDRDGREFTG